MLFLFTDILPRQGVQMEVFRVYYTDTPKTYELKGKLTDRQSLNSPCLMTNIPTY